jgi:uncharacterized membrane protein
MVMWIPMIAVWIFTLGVIIWAIVAVAGRNSAARNLSQGQISQGQIPGNDVGGSPRGDADQILRERFARGEIDETEFEQRKAALRK